MSVCVCLCVRVRLCLCVRVCAIECVSLWSVCDKLILTDAGLMGTHGEGEHEQRRAGCSLWCQADLVENWRQFCSLEVVWLSRISNGAKGDDSLTGSSQRANHKLRQPFPSFGKQMDEGEKFSNWRNTLSYSKYDTLFFHLSSRVSSPCLSDFSQGKGKPDRVLL